MAKLHLKCHGDKQELHQEKKRETVTFYTDNSCKLAGFTFFNNELPPGFSNKRTNADGSVSYDYNGTAIPPAGYPFGYVTTNGNGTGVVKN